MYISIRKYKVTSADELAKRVKAGFLPIISKGPGFIAYYVLNAGNDVSASVSIFETQAGAEESNKMAADWVSKNIAGLVTGGAPEITAGEVSVSSGK